MKHFIISCNDFIWYALLSCFLRDFHVNVFIAQTFFIKVGEDKTLGHHS